MNILAINWRCVKNPEMGGAEVHFHEIFKRVVEKGHHVTLIAHSFDGSSNEEVVDGIKIKRIGNKYLFNNQFRNYYKKQLQYENYDLIVDDISKIPLFTPEYVNKPVIGILHHIHGKSLYKEISAPLAYYIIRKEKQIPKFYSNTPIFTVSESTKNELVELGHPSEKTALLRNAIDHALFKDVKIEKSPTPLITYVGRIKKYKNLKNIIDSLPHLLRKFPDLKFILGGQGDYNDVLKEYVNKLKLNKTVEFAGFLTEEEKAKLLGQAWIFTTMALKEGWGITVIEANAMKTPAVGSDVPGLRDSIVDGETGFLVPLHNIEDLVSKISNLIENNELRQKMGEKAFSWAQKFTWDQSAEFFLEKVFEWYPHLKIEK